MRLAVLMLVGVAMLVADFMVMPVMVTIFMPVLVTVPVARRGRLIHATHRAR
jgi:hypothetical protein